MLCVYLDSGTIVYGVLSFLRTIICTGVAFVVWYLVTQALAGSSAFVMLLVPVWVGGVVGGVIASLFNPRQGIMLAFTCGVLLMVGFLWFRHGMLDMGLGPNPMLTLWPVWFPPAFYIGSYGYLLVLSRR